MTGAGFIRAKVMSNCRESDNYSLCERELMDLLRKQIVLIA